MKAIVMNGLLAVVFGAALPAQKPAEAKGPAPKSPAEAAALQELFKPEQDPDSRIKAGENLITKFADTDYKGTALMLMADAYSQKGDYEKTIVYGERALEADPKNFATMTLLASTIASKTRENDLDKEEKLARSEKYAKDALDVLKDAVKPNPAMPDPQWEAGKKEYASQAHQALGISAMVRKKYDVAINELKTAADTAPMGNPVIMVRLAAAYNQAGKPDEAIAVLDKITDVDPGVKQFVQAERARATKLKQDGAKPAAKPALPPQVEIKK